MREASPETGVDDLANRLWRRHGRLLRATAAGQPSTVGQRILRFAAGRLPLAEHLAARWLIPGAWGTEASGTVAGPFAAPLPLFSWPPYGAGKRPADAKGKRDGYASDARSGSAPQPQAAKIQRTKAGSARAQPETLGLKTTTPVAAEPESVMARLSRTQSAAAGPVVDRGGIRVSRAPSPLGSDLAHSGGASPVRSRDTSRSQSAELQPTGTRSDDPAPVSARPTPAPPAETRPEEVAPTVHGDRSRVLASSSIPLDSASPPGDVMPPLVLRAQHGSEPAAASVAVSGSELAGDEAGPGSGRASGEGSALHTIAVPPADGEASQAVSPSSVEASGARTVGEPRPGGTEIGRAHV